MPNPVTENKNKLFIYISMWALVSGAHFLILYFQYDIRVLPAVADALLFNFLFAAIGWSFWFIVKYARLEIHNALNIIAGHLIAAAMVISFWLTTGYYILQQGFPDPVYQEFLQNSIFWRAYIGFFYYFLTVLVYYLLVYYQNFKEKAEREASLQVMVHQAELNLLKTQINPHFIFNSLNSINYLTINQPQKAREMIVKLSEFLRSTIRENKTGFTPFSQELEMVRLYLDIEKIRFSDRLIFEEQIETGTLNHLIPEMILQPLVENAIKHGVNQSESKIKITIKSWMESGNLITELHNDIPKSVKKTKGEGIGLKNIKSRMELLFSVPGLIQATKEAEQFKVKIIFPDIKINSTGSYSPVAESSPSVS
jgi:two-component system, LytTR family, sensor kinase